MFDPLHEAIAITTDNRQTAQRLKLGGFIEHLEIPLISLINLHILGFIDNPARSVSISKTQDRHSATGAVGVAQAKLNGQELHRWIDPKMLVQQAAAAGDTPQHLFATLQPQLTHHRKQSAQHWKLSQKKAIATAVQVSHKGVVGLAQRFAAAIAVGAEVGQQHLPWCAPLVELLPEGLISSTAETLQQGLAQIEPGAAAQPQLRLKRRATLLEGVQGPGSNWPPDMHKRMIRTAPGQQIRAAPNCSIAPGLTQSFEQWPPVRCLWCNAARRVQGPGSLLQGETIPGQTLVEVDRVVGRNDLSPGIQQL